MKKLFINTLLALSLVSATASAESMRTFTLQGYDDLSLGKFTNIALTEEGILTLGLKGGQVVELPEYNFVDGAIWQNSTYLADAEKSKVVIVDKNGKVTGDIDFEGRLVSGLGVIDKQLYALVSKPAAIYKINAKGGKDLLVDFADSYDYAWQLAPGPKGQLLLVTGEPAAVVQIDGKGNSAQLFTPRQKHLTTMAVSPEGTIYAGGSNTGLIYFGRAGEPFKTFAQCQYSDVQSLLYHDGSLFALVTDGGQFVLDEEAAKDDISGGIYRFGMRGESDLLASATGELLLDMAIGQAGELLISTASMPREQKGQIYSIDLEKRQIAVAYQSLAQRLIKMVSMDKDHWLIVEGGASRLETVSKKKAAQGEYISEIINTKGLSQIGSVYLDGYQGAGQEIAISVRGGQTDNPEHGWQEWSEYIPFPGGQVKLLPARYYQVKIRLSGSEKDLPQLYQAGFSYLRDNDRPVVMGVQAVYNKEFSFAGIKKKLPEENNTIKVTNKNLRELAKGESQSKENGDEDEPDEQQKAYVVDKKGVTTIVWQVSDPAGDKLVNTLYCRQEGSDTWRELLKESRNQYLSLDRSALPDGRYFFKVVTSDAPDNSPERAQSAFAISRLVTIDHKGPEVSAIRRFKEGKKSFVSFAADDALSKLAQVALSVNGQVVEKVLPEDGFFDGRKETFKAEVSESKSPLTIIIEVEDIFGNRTHVEETIK